jgi:hypothetical protein
MYSLPNMPPYVLLLHPPLVPWPPLTLSVTPLWPPHVLLLHPPLVPWAVPPHSTSAVCHNTGLIVLLVHRLSHRFRNVIVLFLGTPSSLIACPLLKSRPMNSSRMSLPYPVSQPTFPVTPSVGPVGLRYVRPVSH